MPRSPSFSSGKISPLLLAFAIPAIVLVFAVIVIVKRGGGGGEPFPYATYLRDADTLRGNSYVVRCQIDGRMSYQEGKGAVIAVRLLDNAGGRIPIFVPENIGRNLEVGQRFNIRVTVRRDVVVADDLEKL